jgi:hypothetical protein
MERRFEQLEKLNPIEDALGKKKTHMETQGGAEANARHLASNRSVPEPIKESNKRRYGWRSGLALETKGEEKKQSTKAPRKTRTVYDPDLAAEVMPTHIGSEGETQDDDKDIMMVIKVTRGMKKAYVDFVSDNLEKGFEGPFALETTILSLLHYKGITNDSSDPSSEEDDSSSGEEDSSSEEEDSSSEEENSSDDKSDHDGEDDQEQDKSKRGALQDQDSSDEEQFDYSACYESTGERRGNPKYPDLGGRDPKRMRTRGDAGIIVESRLKLESKKARYNKYEIIYYYDPKSTPPRYWAGEIKNIYLPGEFPNPADSPDIRYLICPGSDHGIKLHNTVVIEKNLRPLSWGGDEIQCQRLIINADPAEIT